MRLRSGGRRHYRRPERGVNNNSNRFKPHGCRLYIRSFSLAGRFGRKTFLGIATRRPGRQYIFENLVHGQFEFYNDICIR